MGYPRYRFDQRFDSTAQAAAQAAAEFGAPPEPDPVDPLDAIVHSERHLQAAVYGAEVRAFAEGVEQGRREGAAEAVARTDAALAQALSHLDEQLAALDGRFADALRGVEAQGSAVMLALVRRLAPALLERIGAAETERLATDALRLAGGSPRLRLRVHPDLAEPVRARLADPESLGFKGALEVVADPSLPPGGLDAAWEAGGLRYDPAAVERAVDGLCDRALAALSTEHDLFIDTESTASWPH
ncbi:fliH protein (plasmid) [Azospirillum baldaniorum]|uniref:FliH protein n=1 Tax=Azospirillum baldaniorum TaxID=1064539 RepID=A0A9P1K190_9PROT|nr:FliH/SctL family protein [Azospirillum baldaniorum]AWJ94568.1 fliH protein [Azospirillum baldaniorum]NUB10311.1 fliH protein [Azospirillum baldaniorum]TWA70343.1 flagellar assembly protein FliH [Azospirillum brasilense]CCD03640.1 fliH protein [Azospirillum baldaniorum]